MALLGTVVLWGSSFPGIKFVVEILDPMTYAWLRSTIAAAFLAPYMAYEIVRGRRPASDIKGGLLTGIVFALGLWLQGWGTQFTTASNSAFITGLNVVFVHIYMALTRKRYNWRLASSLLLSMTGLYLLTSPAGGFGLGNALVLLGAIMWAAQIILIDKYRPEDPVVFTYAELLPSTLFIIPALLIYGAPNVTINVLLVIAYLAVACADGAFILQAYGQKYIEPATTAIVFLLEPVFATIISIILLHEQVTLIQTIGMTLILSALYLSMKPIS